MCVCVFYVVFVIVYMLVSFLPYFFSSLSISLFRLTKFKINTHDAIVDNTASTEQQKQSHDKNNKMSIKKHRLQLFPSTHDSEKKRLRRKKREDNNKRSNHLKVVYHWTDWWFTVYVCILNHATIHVQSSINFYIRHNNSYRLRVET